jgi:hypothetical protein
MQNVIFCLHHFAYLRYIEVRKYKPIRNCRVLMADFFAFLRADATGLRTYLFINFISLLKLVFFNKKKR